MTTLTEQVSMFQDMLGAKDQVIVKLTNDIFKLEQRDNFDNKSATLPSRGRSLSPENSQVTGLVESNSKQMAVLQVCAYCKTLFIREDFIFA